MPKIINDNQIFQAIIDTITEFGYSGATTRQIAETAGISEVTLFRKFTNKTTMVNLAIAAMVKNIDFESATQYSGDIRSDLIRVIDAYQATAVLYSRFFMVILNEMKHNAEADHLMNAPSELLHHIGELIKHYQSERVLRKEHPLHAASGLLGPLIFTAMINSTKTETKIPALDLQFHIDCFLRGRLNED
ncbi:MAG: TetR/AcrR family transcriptional regulator [Anaerolineaceae bacterium]|nr:TetR/AcrR family transcriptional regulator [Anaerolineaceae bacterium]